MKIAFLMIATMFFSALALDLCAPVVVLSLMALSIELVNSLPERGGKATTA
ncbi:hypothetical protein [Oryzifoliimicrobium ureilyticus]|uniref:hypothetical protein n=1 Tax=Oryzifoliimicrobium ureilyticus TaxID=3113724 RepID=UPI003075FC32